MNGGEFWLLTNCQNQNQNKMLALYFSLAFVCVMILYDFCVFVTSSCAAFIFLGFFEDFSFCPEKCAYFLVQTVQIFFFSNAFRLLLDTHNNCSVIFTITDIFVSKNPPLDC